MTIVTLDPRGGFRFVVLAGAVMAGAFALVSSAEADVKARTNLHSYHVVGQTCEGLLNSLRTNPFHGPNGVALANIRPTYALDVQTRESGGVCSAESVKLDLTFDMTLPQATEGSMAADAQYAWRSFVAFARKHEETHRSIYLDCAKDFISEAQKLTASGGCDSLKAQAARLLEAENHACDLRQQAFDKRDGPRVLGLALFKSLGGGTGVMEASATPIGSAVHSLSSPVQ